MALCVLPAAEPLSTTEPMVILVTKRHALCISCALTRGELLTPVDTNTACAGFELRLPTLLVRLILLAYSASTIFCCLCCCCCGRWCYCQVGMRRGCPHAVRCALGRCAPMHADTGNENGRDSR